MRVMKREEERRVQGVRTVPQEAAALSGRRRERGRGRAVGERPIRGRAEPGQAESEEERPGSAASALCPRPPGAVMLMVGIQGRVSYRVTGPYRPARRARGHARGEGAVSGRSACEGGERYGAVCSVLSEPSPRGRGNPIPVMALELAARGGCNAAAFARRDSPKVGAYRPKARNVSKRRCGSWRCM